MFHSFLVDSDTQPDLRPLIWSSSLHNVEILSIVFFYISILINLEIYNEMDLSFSKALCCGKLLDSCVRLIFFSLG